MRTAVRCLVAATLPALAALGVASGVTGVVGRGPLGAGVALLLAGAVLAGGYVLLTRRMRVPEVGEVAGPVLRRLRR